MNAVAGAMPGSRLGARSTSAAEEPEPCGGAQVLDLAICLILAATVVGLLVLAL